MLKLILMRHAKSSWENPMQSDHERPLNPRGIKSARAMGKWLRKQGHLPDTVLSSSSRRTMETYEGLGFDCPVSFTKKLFHASAEAMLEQLQSAQSSNILILGHNPGIAEFAEASVSKPPQHPDFHRFPTCATLVATFDASTWRDVTWKQGQKTDFAIPREIMSAI